MIRTGAGALFEASADAVYRIVNIPILVVSIEVVFTETDPLYAWLLSVTSPAGIVYGTPIDVMMVRFALFPSILMIGAVVSIISTVTSTGIGALFAVSAGALYVIVNVPRLLVSTIPGLVEFVIVPL